MPYPAPGARGAAPARRRPRTARRVAALLAVAAATLTLTGATGRPTAAGPADDATRATTAAPRDRHTAEEIHRFLTWFYGKHGPSPWQRQRYVSDYLKAKQANTPDHDVLLCAQNTPRNTRVGPVTTAQSAGFGWATVTTYWAGPTKDSFTAYVALDSHPIELYDVDCSD